MKNHIPLLLCTLALFPAVVSAQENSEETRIIRLLQDDAQVRMASKVYELKYVKPTDIRPYIEAAIKRYSVNSKIERVFYADAKRHFLLVSTGEDFLPYVDELIAKIDRPGQPDNLGSIIDGTGITRVAYTPNYRAAEDIVRLVNLAFRTTQGMAYLNKETNTIYWKDDKQAAMLILSWVERFDRPLPQVNLKLNYYELRESKLRDLGMDYLAWKNLPGVNLFGAAYSSGKIHSSEALLNLTGDTSRWGLGGFFAAAQFDLSFIRLLQQSGNAKLLANADLTFVNTPVYEDAALNPNRIYRASLTPDYQNIQKNPDDDTTAVVTGSAPAIELAIHNPVICFAPEADEIAPSGTIPTDEAFYAKNKGNVIFQYELSTRDVVERNNLGDELANSTYTTGSLTLGFQTEKLISSHIKEVEVEENIGVPFLSKLPGLKYLFGTTTTRKEKVYIVVTAEASLAHPDQLRPEPVSRKVFIEELD